MSDLDLVVKSLNDKLTSLISNQTQAQQQFVQLQSHLQALAGAIQVTNDSLADVNALIASESAESDEASDSSATPD